MVEIDEDTAAALGWPKLKYAWVERERRWLCPAVPLHRVLRAEAEFEDMEALAAFPMPDFASREVTQDIRYSGGELVTMGLPVDYPI